MSVQEALKLLRLEMGITQDDLAQKLGKAYITINRWENGKGFPSRSNARKILLLARDNGVSDNCMDYLNEVLLPEVKRGSSAAGYGFPDIDREFLFQLADGSSTAVCVIEAGTHRLLYVNRKAEQEAVCGPDRVAHGGGRGLAEQQDKRCFHYFAGRDEPCPFCPLPLFDRRAYRDVEIEMPETGKRYLVHAKASEARGRIVYSLYLTDITQEAAERSAIYELTNNIPAAVGIYHVYRDRRIELAFMNRMLFRRLEEYRRGAALPKAETELVLLHPQDRKTLMAEIRRAIAQKDNFSLDLRFRGKNNTEQKVRLEAKLIRAAADKCTYYCLFKPPEE